MAFQPGDKLVQFADLKSTLSQSKAIDPALYQTVQTLIERLDKFKSSHDSTVDTINNNVNKIVQNIVITPNIVATYLTLLNEVGQLPQSVQLLAGTNITFDDSVSNRRIVNATSGGADLDYLGNYAPATYNDGDIVIGSDGVAYMCVKDGTTTPPEAWPGSSGGTGSGGGPHAPTHEIGGTDIIDIKLLGGYPSDVTKFLNGTGVFSVPSGGSGGTPSPHHLTHESGGSDPMAVDAIITIGSLRTLGTGPQQAAPGNDTRFTNARPPTVHATTHQIGGSDIVDVKLLGGYPGGTTTFLRADGTFNTPTAGVPGAHHTTHEIGGTDVIQNVAWTNQPNVFTGNLNTFNGGVIFNPTGTQRASIITSAFCGLVFNTTGASVGNKVFDIDNTGTSLVIEARSDDSSLIQSTPIVALRDGSVQIGTTLTAPGGLSTTPLNASQLLSGTVPDARLSSNVALRNVTNTFTANQIISTGVNAEFRLNSTAGSLNNKYWRLVNNANLLRFEPLDDSNTVQIAITFDRAGIITAAGLGNTPLNASNLTSGIVPDVRLSTNVALKNQSNIFTANQVLQYNTPILYLVDMSQPVDQRIFQISSFSQWLYLQGVNDAGSIASGGFQVHRSGNVTATGSIIEQSRTYPIGFWIDFIPTLTPDAGSITITNLLNSKYMLIGKTIFVSCMIDFTTTGSVSSVTFSLPGGIILSNNYQSMLGLVNNIAATIYSSPSASNFTVLVSFGSVLYYPASGRFSFVIILQIQ